MHQGKPSYPDKEYNVTSADGNPSLVKHLKDHNSIDKPFRCKECLYTGSHKSELTEDSLRK